jgi:hypothetical protein
VPGNVYKDTCRTMAHELSHSFFLDDEYAELPGGFEGTEAELGPNVQTQADTLRAGQIHGEEIKWNWHRIRKAGVVAGAITPGAGGRFVVPMEPGHGFAFERGTTVLLRQRQWGRPLLKEEGVFRRIMRVAETPTATQVVVEPMPGEAIDAAEIGIFPAGSLLFIPVPEPDATHPETGPFARLVARNIREHISTTGKPLVAPGAMDDAHVQTPNVDGVSLPFCFKHKPTIVGLYSGGFRFARGVFHPAGTCMMRSDEDEAAEFCAVCRYIIVDLIDPTKHFGIDRDYAEIYPKR